MVSDHEAARAGGALMLAVIPLVVAGVVIDPGLESRPEYFHQSWLQFVPHLREFAVSSLFVIAAGLAALAAAALLLQALGARSATLATGAGVSLAAGGVMLALGAIAGLRIAGLGGEWLAASGASARAIEASAMAAEQFRVMLTFAGLPLLLVGLLAWGVVIHRRSRLPRWLVSLPLLSALIMALSPLGFFDLFNTGFGGYLLISALVLFLWLVAEAAWLARHGARPITEIKQT